ncbi:M15 family metallopeptidase [Idiomarina sp. HP20-50]|uniref:M15 family metallopeptidase n=1 Tax=Idiomarina sp. HP20-50 TaxID=3070813 RepID=UPI00294ADD15|nr:M15 family metallopeptidase [Idiomarina sp. HP20-50]MDV6314954.1 M15 family metallopeptidase [Idiomarina sp. HP20-50]
MLSNTELTGASETHLVTVDGHKLHPAAADAYLTMQKEAVASGLELAIASGFRSLDRQLSIWNRKWRGKLPLLSEQGELLDPSRLTDTEKMHAILHWSALPGSSRHHWGSDFDLYDPRPFQNSELKLRLVPAEYIDSSGPCHKLWQWLTQHAHESGFFFPYARYQGGVAQEPWHLSYRSVSKECQRQLSLETLKDTINSLAIEGKRTILENLAPIKRQYIDTITEDDGWTNIWCG